MDLNIQPIGEAQCLKERIAYDRRSLRSLPDERGYCVILNGDIVPDARRRMTPLADNDELVILPRPRVG